MNKWNWIFYILISFLAVIVIGIIGYHCEYKLWKHFAEKSKVLSRIENLETRPYIKISEPNDIWDGHAYIENPVAHFIIGEPQNEF